MIRFIRMPWFQILLLLVVAAFAVYSFSQSSNTPKSEAAVGDVAPAFKLNPFAAGSSIETSDYKGKGVVLNFWASWCNPCVNELPLLNEAYKMAGIDMVAINVGEDEETIRKFANRYELAFPIAMDREQEVKKQYRVVGLPLTVVIDESGRIIERHEGELTDMADILQLMGQLSR